MSFVTVEDLRVRYGRLEAVKGISLTIPRGEIYGFIGPNGAGKTTTIKVLATLVRPAAGRVAIDGLDVRTRKREIRRRIGYVPDSFGVYDDLTVEEYLHFFAAAYGLDREKRRAVVADVLALTDLGGKSSALVDTLSRGMKQRLSVARVLLHDPDLLLLDEPASGLDPRARIELRELLKELQRMGKTILISSHILHELGQLCTRLGVIESGRVVAEGSLEEIYRSIELLRVVHVQLANGSPELEARIAALPAVARLVRDVDRLALHVRDGHGELEALLEEVQRLGARVRMFQPLAMDMETAFIKLTKGTPS